MVDGQVERLVERRDFCSVDLKAVQLGLLLVSNVVYLLAVWLVCGLVLVEAVQMEDLQKAERSDSKWDLDTAASLE